MVGMMETITAERVCKVLEGAYLLDFHEKVIDDKIVGDTGFADKVYMWCHIVKGNTCENPHEDWVKEFFEAEKLVLDEMKSPKQKRKEAEVVASIVVDFHRMRCGACKVELKDEFVTECKFCNAKFDRISSNHVGLADKLRKVRGEPLEGETEDSESKYPELVGG